MNGFVLDFVKARSPVETSEKVEVLSVCCFVPSVLFIFLRTSSLVNCRIISAQEDTKIDKTAEDL
jgi:hypothetical protein